MKILEYEEIGQNNSLEKYSGKGINLYIDGKRYIDCASGTFNLSLGYSTEEHIEALCSQLHKCCHLSSSYTTEKSKEIFELMKEYLPEQIGAFWFRDIIGSSANECAIRIAQKATGKTDVISLFVSHHGQSSLTTCVSGNAFRRKSFCLSGVNSIKIPAPDCYNCFYSQSNEYCDVQCAKRLEDFIEYASSGQVAAFIMEPILGNGGNIVPDTRYYKIIREICDKYGILIIADEVQTGFGRTGSFFATTGYAKDLRPDIITFAKGAGGIGIPVAGVLMRKELDVLEAWEHSTTSGANPLALVAIEETIKYIRKYNILDNVNEQSVLLEDGLRYLALKYPFVYNVKGKGLMFGFDLAERKDVDEFIRIAYENGLIVRASRYVFGNTIKVRPPLIVTESEINEILEKLELSMIQFSKEKEYESIKI
ncbi:aspartate aminotransferase family protein [Anaeromicropila populeti]|uniref:4-aminobutyrate aminotransferase n=1 Tax=Anaeromicropila populeti TaxID=37658 RepID=A0A1I6JMG7_9FIRM|nr:aspartate aminotransferase family protein [Anaeromicropila populeti]SFR80172.1 4-aminobutyrate aminotransferase [Anaeromicropila populeti]